MKINKQIRSKQNLKIVCFGGGNAIPKLLLEPLKKYSAEITSITSMLENGGSTGQLREDFDILPAGDISRHLIFLSDAPKWKKELFYLRFGREKFPRGHRGHRFGTVFISLMEHTLGDFKKSLKFAHKFLEIKNHQALPATLDKTHLFAVLENGKVIKGEDEIDVPKKHNPKLKIKKIFLKPKAKVFPAAKKAIVNADLIVLGPGDIYSSIICCLLPGGMKEAIQKSKSKKILIVNAMNKLGETNDFSVLDFTGEVEKYINCPLNYVLYNTEVPDKRRIKEYKKDEPLILDLVKIDKNLDKKKFIGKNLLTRQGPIIYDSKKIIKEILKI